jgi:hypothetical protein
MAKNAYPLGKPGDDTEEAAQLFMRYLREQPLSRDLARSFFMMCGDAQAVAERVAELKAREPA